MPIRIGSTGKNKEQGRSNQEVRAQDDDRHLPRDHRERDDHAENGLQNQNVAKLLAWASLPAIERINHSLTANDQIQVKFRSIQGRKPWVLKVLMN